VERFKDGITVSLHVMYGQGADGYCSGSVNCQSSRYRLRVGFVVDVPSRTSVSFSAINSGEPWYVLYSRFA
jgi:hypothetical protein